MDGCVVIDVVAASVTCVLLRRRVVTRRSARGEGSKCRPLPEVKSNKYYESTEYEIQGGSKK